MVRARSPHRNRLRTTALRAAGRWVPSARRRAAGLWWAAVCWGVGAMLGGCKQDYRVGDRVWVQWDERNYPAYIIEQKTKTRFRVHFDGYSERWDEDVTLERIQGLVEGQITPPPPPKRVARTLGLAPKGDGQGQGPRLYAVGDRVRVRWRRAIYSATVIDVPDSGPGYRVHYDGHESAWDETVPQDRIVGRR